MGNCKHAGKSENKEAIVKCINMFYILAEVKNKPTDKYNPLWQSFKETLANKRW